MLCALVAHCPEYGLQWFWCFLRRAACVSSVCVFCASEPSNGVHCRVWVMWLPSVKAVLSAVSRRCCAWNVNGSSEGLARKAKIMALSSSGIKVPQQILSVIKFRKGYAHVSQERKTQERENSYLRVNLNWKLEQKRVGDRKRSELQSLSCFCSVFLKTRDQIILFF